MARLGRGASAAIASLLAGVVLTAGEAAQARTLAFKDLTGWAEDTHGITLEVFKRSCTAIAKRPPKPANEAIGRICAEALAFGTSVTDDVARKFFERRFRPVAVIDGDTEIGLFTGYFEPQFAASPSRTANFTVPLRRPPAGLEILKGKSHPKGIAADFTHGLRQNGTLVALPDRLAIEAGALDDLAPAIAWLRSPVDAFFLHVQGSGRLQYPDGTVHRVGYGGKNGHPYTSIGRVLVNRGIMVRDEVSMQSLRTWLEADGPRARQLMGENRSYIFFRPSEDPGSGLGPIGQQGVPLTAGRSLAVDLGHHRAGSLLWLETLVPGPDGAALEIFSRLMVAQDTGSAIRGRIRGDIFFGSGDKAGDRAGKMQSQGRLVALVPRP